MNNGYINVPETISSYFIQALSGEEVVIPQETDDYYDAVHFLTSNKFPILAFDAPGGMYILVTGSRVNTVTPQGNLKSVLFNIDTLGIKVGMNYVGGVIKVIPESEEN